MPKTPSCRGVVLARRKHEPLVRPCKNPTADKSGFCHRCRLDSERIESLLAVLVPDWANKVKGGAKARPGRGLEWPEYAEEPAAPPPTRTRERREEREPERSEGTGTAVPAPSPPVPRQQPKEAPHAPKDYRTLLQESKNLMERERKRREGFRKLPKP